LIGEFTGIRWRNDLDLKVNCFWLEHYGYDEGDPTKQYWKDSQSVWVRRRGRGPPLHRADEEMIPPGGVALPLEARLTCSRQDATTSKQTNESICSLRFIRFDERRPRAFEAFAGQFLRRINAEFAAAGDFAGGVVEHVGSAFGEDGSRSKSHWTKPSSNWGNGLLVRRHNPVKSSRGFVGVIPVQPHTAALNKTGPPPGSAG